MDQEKVFVFGVMLVRRLLSFFRFVVFFRATPAAHESSWFRGPVGAAAAGLYSLLTCLFPLTLGRGTGLFSQLFIT